MARNREWFPCSIPPRWHQSCLWTVAPPLSSPPPGPTPTPSSWRPPPPWTSSSLTSLVPPSQLCGEQFTVKESGWLNKIKCEFYPCFQHRYVSFSRANDSLIATSGRPGNCLKVRSGLILAFPQHSCAKVCHAKSSQALVTCQQPVVGGLSWHLRFSHRSMFKIHLTKLCQGFPIWLWEVTGKWRCTKSHSDAIINAIFNVGPCDDLPYM